MKRLWLWGLVQATLGWGQPLALSPASELTLNGPWVTPVPLEIPAEGTYRLEATLLGGDPVEILVEHRGTGPGWRVTATNRTIRGALGAGAEFTVAQGDWRVRPVQEVRATVVLRLQKTAFSGLREALKQDLTPVPAASLPLRLRASFPEGTGSSCLAAAAGSRGQLWVAWITDPGDAEVWDAGTQRRLGNPLVATHGPWTALTLAGEPPVVTVTSGQGRQAWGWSGTVWQEEAPGASLVTNRFGTFRFESEPFPRVWRQTSAGWQDLELPRNRLLDRLLTGSTEDGVYVFLASSTGRERAFYLWDPQEGWKALPPLPAAGPPRPGLWAASNGAASLYYAEATPESFLLQRFDGQTWGVVVDLAKLAPRGVRGLALLGPSPWSRSGSLVLAGDRVEVYDLP